MKKLETVINDLKRSLESVKQYPEGGVITMPPQDAQTLLNAIEERWIPVTERLPEDDTVVLGSNGNWVQQLDYNSERYRQKGFWFNENDAEYTTDYTDKITCWQYLPTPPKG